MFDLFNSLKFVLLIPSIWIILQLSFDYENLFFRFGLVYRIKSNFYLELLTILNSQISRISSSRIGQLSKLILLPTSYTIIWVSFWFFFFFFVYINVSISICKTWLPFLSWAWRFSFVSSYWIIHSFLHYQSSFHRCLSLDHLLSLILYTFC